MNIIEITSLSNGAHRNQTGEFLNIPEGWAVVPSDLETPNFPFGEVEMENVDGLPTVVKWSPGEMPEPVYITPTPAERREEAYNTQPTIAWDGELLTVTAAAQKWQYYAAEGSTKADELQVLIAAAKHTIRDQYPDEEAKAE